MLQRIRYFSVATADLEGTIELYQKLFGLEVMSPIHDTRWGFRAAMLGNGKEALVELMQPSDPNSALARFMKERAYPSNPNGEGVYLVSAEVDNVAETVKQIKEQGGRITQEDESGNVAWVHPASTNFAFIELSQRRS